MKFYSLLILFLLSTTYNYAQEVQLTETLANSWKEANPFQGYYHKNLRKYYTGLRLDAAQYYNTIQKRLGLKDTLTLHKNSNSEYEFKFKDRLIESQFDIPLSIPDNFLLGYGYYRDSIFIHATCHTSDTTFYQIKTDSRVELQEDPTIQIEYYTNGFLNGRSEKFTESGKTLYKGNYMLKDTMYQDTVVEWSVDDNEKIMVYKRLFVPKKCGLWIEQSSEGNKIEEIEYLECPENKN